MHRSKLYILITWFKTKIAANSYTPYYGIVVSVADDEDLIDKDEKGKIFIAGQAFEVDGKYDGLKGMNIYIKKKPPLSLILVLITLIFLINWWNLQCYFLLGRFNWQWEMNISLI